MINGTNATDGVADMTVCSPVTITSTGADNGRTFTILGRDANGRPQAEEITGPNIGTVNGNKTFTKIDRVIVDADTAGAITVGESETLPRGLRRKTMDPEQSFKLRSIAFIPFDSGGGIETAGSFGSGSDTTQTATNQDQRARYTPVDQTGDLEIIYLADLSKEGIGVNYVDSRQTEFSAI